MVARHANDYRCLAPVFRYLETVAFVRYHERVRSSRLLVPVLLIATACGQATHGSTPATTHTAAPKPQVALADYASRTAHAGSARLALVMDMTSPGGEVTAHAAGVVAFRTRAADIAMRMTAANGLGLRMREIVLWPDIYVHSPALAHLKGAHQPWVKIDMARIGRTAGLNMDALAGAGSDDPAQMLTTLEGESDSVTKVGPGSVRGVPATRYHALIDLAKVARTAPADLRATVRRAERRLMRVTGVRQFPMDVWIDADGLVRRVAYHISLTIPGSAQQVTTSVRLDLFDFGTPVHVHAPPAGQTRDLTALVAAQAQAGTG
jgi:hypothetical protein